MGQYFRAVFVDDHNQVLRAVDPDDYDLGIKFGASMMADSPAMTAVESLLALDGGGRLVWAGDYAPETFGPNLYFSVQPDHLVGQSTPRISEDARRFLCNADSGEFIDRSTLPSDNYGNRISPLSTLTVEAGGFQTGPWARKRLYASGAHPGGSWIEIDTRAWVRF